MILTHPHQHLARNEASAFLRRLVIDPYIRSFVSACAHSRHGQFVDPRHIGRAAHLWAGFEEAGGTGPSPYGGSLPTSPSF